MDVCSLLGPFPCPVYLRLHYIGENLIFLAKQASLAIKSIFYCISLRVVCNTNRPLNGIVKDATFIHDLINAVYIFLFHCKNDNVGRTSKRFHVNANCMGTKKFDLIFSCGFITC